MGFLAEEWLLKAGDTDHIGRAVFRLLVAAVLGGLLGYERESEGKAAGLRTHILVAVGSALFVLVPLEAGATLDQITRVVQGLTVGIGFLGAGAILKMTEEQKIIGLTTAANLWVTTAVGMAVGIGLFWPAVIAVVLGWVVLLGLGLMEPWLRTKRKK